MSEVQARLVREKIVAVVRTDSFEEAKQISMAMIEVGITMIEITMTVPEAPILIELLKNQYQTDVLVGAGTVATKEEATECFNHRADFLVSPYLIEEVAQAGETLGIPVFSGAMSMKEVAATQKYPNSLVKIFPANIVGAPFLKAVKSVIPTVQLMPTGGVNEKNIVDWFKAGADCVGIGSDLVRIYRKDGVTGLKEYGQQLQEILASTVQE
ncbi:bifunctional 4-hydroxy-2-oxoglutarate aldolase/2-dehydro-3-deoxy-phosphogluconate aldolase [Paenilisteria rocourtiae]|uniref:2-keto-3-deoxy-phosphogluconate aldolase n=1 Tax=Listeria rocourtiae TaxID=647910 RepID=A0A4V3DQB4_9LIST|nr:bifunctional 4-hydroxy-2-oxoglutarate aldolase/2-dehydro-3-deoxy-phosphogluconate aldolase [Listeria rocourtiae]EUJ43120.1 2-dehydro-3-deoxyphosphogluconate aldolase [Listeria rocourtiae FSL F6-920]MBC1435582.1 bifunctional 4-hydroxy-2-oxoglutarate aldolase/2-dehydro-3-deoxy-phosphogluconate aldolase [Listeria rocourtiae]TDR55566.1 2-keto-3-deoxy-phosphogluconate aldolase [Listeria rocourtiae]